MGQFKPMVKMETTEPSVELKLKKGGKVAKKADGGMMGSPMSAAGPMPPAMPASGGMPMSRSPMKPSLAMRRRAMKGLPAGAGPAGPIGGAASMQPSMPAPMAPPAMKKGGKADMGQDKAMIKKAFKQHDMQEHKGGKGTSLKLKHGGKMATGGVVNGQGGFKKGGAIAKDGIINTEGQGGEYRNTKMDTAKPNHSPAKTGGVKLGNGGGYKEGGMTMVEKGGKMVPDFAADGKGKMKHGGMAYATGGVTKSNGGGYKKGGKIKGMMYGGMAGDSMMDEGMMGDAMYKKGGSTKKAYAAGGTVNSGRPVAMPQGSKPAAKPVRINELAGTYKAGGKVTPAQGRLQKISASENAPAFRAAKKDSNEKYGPASRMKLAEGGNVDLSKGAYDKAIGPDESDMDMARAIRSIPRKMFSGVKSLMGQGSVTEAERKAMLNATKPSGSVTKTKESVTVTPAGKKRGGMAC